MKGLITAGMFMAAIATGFAQQQSGPQTAYEALRTVGSAKGQAQIAKVISVSGDGGATQPVLWRIRLQDESARDGVREFEVSGGMIVSERTPIQGGGGTAMDLARLNLDSDGAFKLAHSEAATAKIGFDSANYRLAVDRDTGAPEWRVELVDYKGRVLADLDVAATTGVVKSFKVRSASDDESEVNSSGSGEGFFHRAGRTLRKTGNNIAETTKDAAGSVQQWATGNRTVGTDDDDENDD